MDPGRRRLVIALGLLGAVIAAPTGWFVTDHLEQDDEFCVSCHLTAETPLHEHKLADFRGRPAVSLVAAHAVAGNEAAADGAFRCIDCHGGVGLVGRARVKALSAKDAFWYVVGRFDEPDQMHWPLWDQDCTQCHATYTATAPEGADPLFHEIAEHNAELGVDCVECHLSHDTEALASHYYVVPGPVRTQCARCHPEFEEALQ